MNIIKSIDKYINEQKEKVEGQLSTLHTLINNLHTSSIGLPDKDMAKIIKQEGLDLNQIEKKLFKVLKKIKTHPWYEK